MPVQASMPNMLPITNDLATLATTLGVAQSAITALQALNPLLRLSTTNGIDLKVQANTNLYTVLTGKSAVILMALVRVTSSSAPISVATAGIGVNANADDIFASIALTGLTGLGGLYRLNLGLGLIATEGQVIKFGVDVAAVATTLVASVDLVGYLI